jgi:glutathione synthase/RimK-type ligase-like ATP-grasp enzyme
MAVKAMFAYNSGSEGARELKTAMMIPMIKHHGSSFRPGAEKVILNWGATTDRYPAALLSCRIINHPTRVDSAVDKVATFNLFREHGVSSPEFTTSKAEAIRWCESGSTVFARTILRAHSGRGIEIMDPDHPDTLDVNAPLYVKYIPKKFEYRIHVMNGEVIDTQRKGLKEEFKDRPNVNHKIRNLANGFIYVRNDGHVVPECVRSVGIHAVTALGLDFGAVDVIYNQRENRAYALEVNTAPGLSGTTVTNYRDALVANF